MRGFEYKRGCASVEAQLNTGDDTMASLEGEYVPSTLDWVREQIETYERSGGREANTLRDTGIPVIVVSTELDEVYALADRIAVMYRGGIVGIVPGDTPREVLGLMMAGEVPASVVPTTKESAA